MESGIELALEIVSRLARARLDEFYMSGALPCDWADEEKAIKLIKELRTFSMEEVVAEVLEGELVPDTDINEIVYGLSSAEAIW